MFGTLVNCNVTIDGKELCLVPTTKAHLAKCQQMINDPEIARFLLSRFAFTVEQEDEWFKKGSEDPDSVVWSILLGDEHIGQAGIHGINYLTRTAATGIVIDKAFWGKGVATAVMKARAIYAKNHLNLIVLYTEICLANKASWHAARNAGYKKYGCKPLGMFTEGKYYSLWLGCLDLTK